MNSLMVELEAAGRFRVSQHGYLLKIQVHYLSQMETLGCRKSVVFYFCSVSEKKILHKKRLA